MSAEMAGKVPTAYRVLQVAAVVAAFGCTYVAGHRGVYTFDQSMVFDGGWRILCGQIPYKDFIMAFTPLAFAIQALFFKIFGVTWSAYVISGATLASLAALSVMRTAVVLYGQERRWLGLAAGFMVGCTLQSVFGTLWIENVSVFFMLLGLQAIAESTRHEPAGQRLWMVVAGLSAGLAFLGKQNSGALAILFLGASAFVVALPRLKVSVYNATLFVAGVATVLLVFTCWLSLFSDTTLFLRHAIEVPMHVGEGRLRRSDLFLPKLFLAVPGSTQWVNALALGSQSLAICLLVWNSDFRKKLLASRTAALCMFLPGALALFHCCLQRTTLNGHHNLLSLASLTLCVSLGLLGVILGELGTNGLRQWSGIVGPVVGSCILVEGLISGAWNRGVHDGFPKGCQVLQDVSVPSLHGLRWVAPTVVSVHQESNPDEIKLEDLEAVCAYLSNRDEPFFVLGDCALLYGVLMKPSPHPLLYFQNNHYYTSTDADKLDSWMLAKLQELNIPVVIRERSLYSENFGATFPKTNMWISEHFLPDREFGHFGVLVQRAN